MQWVFTRAIIGLFAASALLGAFGHCPVLADVPQGVISASVAQSPDHGSHVHGSHPVAAHSGNIPSEPPQENCALDLLLNGGVQAQSAIVAAIKSAALGPADVGAGPALRDTANLLRVVQGPPPMMPTHPGWFGMWPGNRAGFRAAHALNGRIQI